MATHRRLSWLALVGILLNAAPAGAQSQPSTPSTPYTTSRLYPPRPTYAVPTPPTVGTLSTNRYAMPAPVVPPTVRYSLPKYGTDGPAIVARDGKYLGRLNGNRYDPDSVSNPYGRYGSKYSPDSINNPYGSYGSKYSPLSPNNPYATEAPLIIGR